MPKKIRKIIKRILAAFLSRGIEKIDIDQPYKYISFDVFDTMIFRTTLKPEDVFDIVQSKLEDCGKWRHQFRFRDIRQEAEKRARKNNSSGEVLLDAIYDEMQFLSDHEKKDLMQIEQETEYELCYPNPDMLKLYKDFLGQKKKVVFCSDMYLPSDTIRKLLEKCGISDFEKLYVSGELGVNKRSGELFDFVLSDLGIDKKEILHIGDNPIGDYLTPKTRRICAFLYKRKG